MLSNGLRRSFFLGFELDLSGHRNLAMAIRSEVTMLERAALALCLSLPAIRGVSADPNVVDVSTWRWNVSAILRAQHDDEINSPSKDAWLKASLSAIRTVFAQRRSRHGIQGAWTLSLGLRGRRRPGSCPRRLRERVDRSLRHYFPLTEACRLGSPHTGSDRLLQDVRSGPREEPNGRSERLIPKNCVSTAGDARPAGFLGDAASGDRRLL